MVALVSGRVLAGSVSSFIGLLLTRRHMILEVLWSLGFRMSQREDTSRNEELRL